MGRKTIVARPQERTSGNVKVSNDEYENHSEQKVEDVEDNSEQRARGQALRRRPCQGQHKRCPMRTLSRPRGNDVMGACGS